jgi:hypothetical protein
MAPSRDVLCEEAVTVIGGDRRSRQRYPAELPLEFKIWKDGLPVNTGTGTTVNMSSGGIAFETSAILSPGEYLELSIGWPVKLNAVCPLKLVASGRVVRSEANLTVIKMERYEFRTQSAAARHAMAQRAASCGAGF